MLEFILSIGIIGTIIIVFSLMSIHALSKVIVRIREYKHVESEVVSLLEAIQSVFILFIIIGMLMVVSYFKTVVIP
jgi:hypothetical protein